MSDTISAPPLVMTAAGPQPTPPATLNELLISLATQLSPGLTVLPGVLIDDIAGTDTGALVVLDQARVDLINSVSPLTANPYLLNQLGQIYGVPLGQGSNTSVGVVFTGPPGFPIPNGFTVSDGTYQYVISTGGVIGTGGQSTALLAVATQPGAWPISVGAVNQLVTSVPTGVTPAVTVTNPFAGSPATSIQTEAEYRVQVLQAGKATATGVTALCKTALNQVVGVNPNLVSIRQLTGSWEVIVGGSGDPYQIGFAILRSFGDIASLVGSTMQVTGITNANPGVITTNINHGYTSGQVFRMSGATGLVGLNNTNLTATVLTPTSFSIGVNTLASGTYTGNGVITPNFRNQIISISEYPDVYNIPYVVPPAQTLTMTLTWNTSAPNFTGASSVASAAQGVLSDYINSLSPGAPINIYDMESIFRASIVGLIPSSQVTRIAFAVSINGIGFLPQTGTGIIVGDPESYYVTTPSSIIVNQG